MDSTYFETRYAPHPDRQIVWKAISEYLQNFVAPSSVIMDVGAGYCDFINQIRGSRKYAIDVNPDVGRWCNDGVQFLHVTEIESISLPPQSIDVIMVSNLLEHLSPGGT